MSTTVAQPTQNPTRKLAAAVIAAAVVETLRVATNALWPGLFDMGYWSAIMPVAIYVTGYFVKDEPNVPSSVVVQTEPIENA